MNFKLWKHTSISLKRRYTFEYTGVRPNQLTSPRVSPSWILSHLVPSDTFCSAILPYRFTWTINWAAYVYITIIHEFHAYFLKLPGLLQCKALVPFPDTTPPLIHRHPSPTTDCKTIILPSQNIDFRGERKRSQLLTTCNDRPWGQSRDELTERRKKMVMKAYNILDRDGSGEITVKDIIHTYDVSNHKDFIDGRKSRE